MIMGATIERLQLKALQDARDAQQNNNTADISVDWDDTLSLQKEVQTRYRDLKKTQAKLKWQRSEAK